MVQEIIAYMIIGSAITLAILKIIKRFRKKQPRKVNFKKDKITMGHNCSECSAECILRDLPKQLSKKDSVGCKKK